MGLTGLDYVIISREVEQLDPSTMENLLRAANATQQVPMIKLRHNTPEEVVDALTAGAPMVLVPHVTTRAQLDRLVAASRFPPKGTRGLCAVARYAGFGATSLESARAYANREPSIIPIIEDKAALDNLDDIMSSPDIEIVEIGPWDLSQSLGVIPEKSYGNPETMRAVEAVCAAAKRHGKKILAPTWLPAPGSKVDLIQLQHDELVSRGITLIYHLIDIMILVWSYRPLMALRELRAP
jgi:4-hydroxy-2-oxoheptanedioate aldolase